MRPVLIIDDDADIRETLQLVLDAYGWTVATAQGGDEALRWLRDEREGPCLILLDLMMPGMNGFEFREHQLADPVLAAIPTVVMTGAGTLPGSELARLGKLDMLIKPVELHVLRDCLDRHCRKVH
jgi:DNA-binding NtrC family response regulator